MFSIDWANTFFLSKFHTVYLRHLSSHLTVDSLASHLKVHVLIALFFEQAFLYFLASGGIVGFSSLRYHVFATKQAQYFSLEYHRLFVPVYRSYRLFQLERLQLV